MSSVPHKKVAWLEGQFLYPQHFQLQERYLEHRIEQRCAAIKRFVEGFTHCVIDDSTLAKGKVGARRLTGIMPDGLPFDLPRGAALPEALEIKPNIADQMVCLALPLYRPGSQVITREEGKSTIRYRCDHVDVYDDHDIQASKTLTSAEPAFSLRLENDVNSGWDWLPIARIKEVTSAGAVLLDEDYVPPMLLVAASERLMHYSSHMLTLLSRHVDTLVARLTASQGKGGNLGFAELRDEQLLRLLSGAYARLSHWHEGQHIHPEALYECLAVLLAELTAYTPIRKGGFVAPYRHNNLVGCLAPLVEGCNLALKQLLKEVAEQIKLEVVPETGVRLAESIKPTLLLNGDFVLAAYSKQLAQQSLRQIIASATRIAEKNVLVGQDNYDNFGFGGVQLVPLDQPPPEIHSQVGWLYFKLDTSSSDWAEIRNTGRMAINIAGVANLPGLEIRLYGIYGQR